MNSLNPENMLERYSEIFFGNTLAILSSLVLLVSIFFILTRLINRLSRQGLNITTRRLQSKEAETSILKYSFGGIGISILGLIIANSSFMQPTANSINQNSWVGDWSVNLEEFGEMEYRNPTKYQVEFSKKENKIEGILYNDKGREQGFLKEIKFDKSGYGFMCGKFGNNDGRKLEFQFMMFPDQKSFLGKYRKRNTNDDWEIWVSHKIEN